MFDYLREHLAVDIGSAHLVIDGASVNLLTDGELIDELQRGQGVLNVLSLVGVKSELDADISRETVALTPVRPAADPDLAAG